MSIVVDDRYFEIFDAPQVQHHLTEMRECVEQKDLDGFNEIVPKYDCSLLELILEASRK